MELSIVERPSPKVASPEQQCAGSLPALQLFEIALPEELRHLGESVRASAWGDPRNLPIVVLGGISADCLPEVRPGGAPGWWAGLAGEGKAVDVQHHYVIGVDFAADDNGTVAPSTADQARVLSCALDQIGIKRPAILVGASYGGMVALALAAAEPWRVDSLVLVCAAHEPHPVSTAARELQRRVVALGLLAGRGPEALGIARGMAMLTYRTADEFEQRFSGGIGGPSPLSCSKPGEYLRARGQSFGSVMSPGRFLSLSASIDRHQVDPRSIHCQCLLIGAESDQLVLPGQLRALAAELGACELHLINSLYGHDMFLKEADQVGQIVARFLAGRQ